MYHSVLVRCINIELIFLAELPSSTVEGADSIERSCIVELRC